MNVRTSGWLTLVALCGLGLAGCSQKETKVATTPQQDPDAGFITLFDGKSTEGWAIYREDNEKIDPEAFFVKDGMIGCKGIGYHWFRYEAREFGDFVLKLEFMMEKGSNSGICMRTTRTGSPPYTGFEVQVLDEFGKEPHKNSCGAIYDVVVPMFNAAKPPGEWNQLEVTCKGPLVVVVLNGLKVIDTDFAKLTKPIGKFGTPYAELSRSGLIALQDHWKPITWYRNIRVKPL